MMEQDVPEARMVVKWLPVRGIAVFEAAARSASFHAAAEELNLTPSAISHQIRLLEETLGVRLFDRIGRGVTLTSEGAEYARSIRPSLQRLRMATNQIRLRAKAGEAVEVVRVEMPPSLAHYWLLPRLADLVARHPGIDIRINAQGAHLQGDRLPLPSPADAPADLQIVYGDDRLWADRASPLLAELYKPLCAPSLCVADAITSPEHLLNYPLISTAQNAVSWEEWFNWQGIDLDRSSTLQMDPSHLAIEAAVRGMGVILESSVLAEQEVAAGRLVAPFPGLNLAGLYYWLFSPTQRDMKPAVRIMFDWLIECAGAASGATSQNPAA